MAQVLGAGFFPAESLRPARPQPQPCLLPAAEDRAQAPPPSLASSRRGGTGPRSCCGPARAAVVDGGEGEEWWCGSGLDEDRAV
jgi:hypothetical protein